MVETIADRRLHPATLFTRFIRKVPEFVLGLPALIGLASDADMRHILLLALAGALFSFLLSLLGWLRFRYGVGENDIVIESGVLHRQRRIIPFARVQDIDIEQGLLARMFGTAKVRIETGGASSNEGNLDAVSLDEAMRLRDFIRRSAARGSLPQHEEPAEPVLFAMTLPRLLLAGLFNFSLFYLAVIGGMFQYLRPFLKRNSIDPAIWIAPSREAAIQVSLAVVATLLLLGVVTGVLRTVARDYRFRLTRAPAGFRRRRGLFTLSEAVIPIHRLQLVVLGTGWLRRRLGWFSLDFQTLGADAQQSGYQPAAPFARMDEIMPIVAEAGMDALPGGESYVPVSRFAIARRCLTVAVPLSILAIVATQFAGSTALLLLVPILGLALFAIPQWRHHRFCLTGHFLFVAEGVLRQRLWIVPFAKLQTISVTRSPLQRRLGLSSVSVDTAGASLLNYPVVRDLSAPVAEALAMELVRQHRAAVLAARASPVEVIDAVDECAADPPLHQQGDGHQGEAP